MQPKYVKLIKIRHRHSTTGLCGRTYAGPFLHHAILCAYFTSNEFYQTLPILVKSEHKGTPFDTRSLRFLLYFLAGLSTHIVEPYSYHFKSIFPSHPYMATQMTKSDPGQDYAVKDQIRLVTRRTDRLKTNLPVRGCGVNKVGCAFKVQNLILLFLNNFYYVRFHAFPATFRNCCLKLRRN